MESQISSADQVDKSPQKGKKGQKPPGGNFADCFRFASVQDYFVLFCGLVLAVFNGAGMACFGLVIGLAINTFDTRFTEDQAREYSKTVVWYFVALGIIIFVGTFGSRTLLRLNARRQGYNIRKAYLTALLKKDISYFDEVNPMEVSSQVETDCKTIVDTLDVKMESIVFTLGALGAGIISAFARSWQITLMVFISVPFIVGSMILYIATIVKAAGQRSRAYSKAGGIAEESLSHIRTVVSLGGEKAEVTRYDHAVKEFQKMLSRAGIYQGMASGFREMVFYLLAGVIFYIGSFKLENDVRNPTTGNVYLPSDIFTPISAIYVSFSQLPLVATSLKAINNAKVKIKKILDVIDSVQDDKDTSKETIKDFKGEIEFKNVGFSFPNRSDKKILDNLSFSIKPGKKIAFVGESGSGKSTIIQLLQGFYEPQEGTVKVDGHDLKNLNVSKLREQIAYVGQEPIIFSLSIRENLLLAKADATEDELITALKKANAYKFVNHMEKKMDTPIGGSTGAQLSGGQKQRIAIARAMLRDTKVLLLDEATSALDRLSEKQIQETLDNLEGERTMIIIAHRLSTIQTADQIIVLDQGKMVEVGTHEELLEKRGKYYEMHASHVGVDTQTSVATPEKNSPNREEKKEAKKVKKSEEQQDEQEGSDDNEETALMKGEGSPVQERNRNEEEEEEEKKKEKERRTVTFADIKKLWGMAKSERKYFIIGMLGSLGAAMITPCTHVLMSGSLDAFVKHDDPDFRETINIYCILLLSVSVLVFLFYTLEISFFAKASETLIQSLRVDIFYKFLRMHIGWHDQPENTPGNLASSLEMDTANVGQLTGTSLGLIVQIILTNLFALIVAFAASWQLALIGMWIIPVVLSVAVLLSSNEAKGGEQSQEPLQKAEVIVSEVLNNMKTVVSMNADNKFLKEYTSSILQMEKTLFKVRVMNGVYEGAMSLVLYAALAGMYYVGTDLYFTLNLSPMRIFLAVFGLALTAFFSTQLFFLMPDTGRAVHSVRTLLDHLERKSEIDIEDKENKCKDKIQGNIEFKNVKFAFPTRPVEIFSDLNFKIEAGKHVGITGPSGCGKSTIVQLLYRFYNVDDGEILIEGKNIQEYDLQYLRKKVGGVFQEPVLFNETIEYNLKYANEDVNQNEMKEACQKANALRFIESKSKEDKEDKEDKGDKEGKEGSEEGASPQEGPREGSAGFQRVVGSKGGQLSGGQKQRIAIARAMLRKPKVLLLDEATSALDASSENTVQDALNKASQGLTTICIAHRFSTIKEMDEILVLEGGKIVEQGTYDELIEKKGHFYNLKEGEDI